jgi:hypothetical protein
MLRHIFRSLGGGLRLLSGAEPGRQVAVRLQGSPAGIRGQCRNGAGSTASRAREQKVGSAALLSGTFLGRCLRDGVCRP